MDGSELLRKTVFSSTLWLPFSFCLCLIFFCSLDLIDQALLKEWSGQGLLAQPENQKERLVIPQVLIDGVFVGDGSALQDMEEDGDLGKEIKTKHYKSSRHSSSHSGGGFFIMFTLDGL